jgi:hypothetical protein
VQRDGAHVVEATGGHEVEPGCRLWGHVHCEAVRGYAMPEVDPD